MESYHDTEMGPSFSDLLAKNEYMYTETNHQQHRIKFKVYEKEVLTVMINNFTTISKTNNHLSFQICEHKTDHDI